MYKNRFLDIFHGTTFVKVYGSYKSPPSSAAIKRVFSYFGLVHKKLKNRLGIITVSKLVFCYRMLQGNFDLDY